MKKRLLTLALGIATFLTLPAQVVVTPDGEEIKPETATTATAGDYSHAADYYASWNKDAEILGIGFGGDIGKSGYMEFGYSLGLGDIDWWSSVVGFGLQKRFINENFLLQAKAFPYIGLNSFKESKYNSKTGKITEDDKLEFTYGAAARLEAGLKLWETKKKNRLFLTVGYEISAPEFETENMFDNGDWVIGITLVK